MEEKTMYETIIQKCKRAVCANLNVLIEMDTPFQNVYLDFARRCA